MTKRRIQQHLNTSTYNRSFRRKSKTSTSNRRYGKHTIMANLKKNDFLHNLENLKLFCVHKKS